MIISIFFSKNLLYIELQLIFIFLGSKITVDGDTVKLKDACSLEGKLW